MSSGAGDQSRAAAERKEAEARLARLQADTMDTNIGLMTDAITSQLNVYDLQAGQALGSTSLQLARSGSMSRGNRKMATRQQLGLDNLGIKSPIESLNEDLAKHKNDLSTYNDLVSQRSALQAQIRDLGTKRKATYTYNDGQTTGTYYGPPVNPNDPDSWPEGYRPGYTEYTEEERAKKKELQKQVDDLTNKIENLNIDPARTKEHIDLLERGIAKVEQAAAEIEKEAPEDITRPGQLNYTAGSTHTQMSKALQHIYLKREDIINSGLKAITEMGQQAVLSEEGATMAMQTARAYEDLADDQDFNAMVGNIMTGAGLVAGAVGGAFLAGPTGGIINPVSGASLGAQGGSFLGNAFAR